MSNLTLNTMCEKKVTLKKGTRKGDVNNSYCNLHAVTVRPVDGISNAEIALFRNQLKTDIDSGIVLAASLGVEKEDKERHLHIALRLR